MKVTYDRKVDILRILLSDAPIYESDEERPGIILDYAERENLVGLEILDASQRVKNPRSVDFSEVAGSST